MKKPIPNKNEFYLSKLDNSLTVMLVCNNDTLMSAAALDVRAGSFNNPPDF